MSSGTTSGRGPPNTAIVLEKTKRGGLRQPGAGLEQRARRVDVDAHADVEFRLGLAASTAAR